MKKKIEVIKDLSLEKETVSKLNEEQLKDVEGGAASWTLLGLCSIACSLVGECGPPPDDEK